MALVMTVRTDSWHYRYYLWIRDYWGFSSTYRPVKACPYWQTIVWFTVGCVLSSPLLAVAYGSIKAAQLIALVANAVSDRMSAGKGIEGNSLLNPVDYTPHPPSRVEKFFDKIDNFADSAILASGIGKAVLGAAVVLACGVLSLFVLCLSALLPYLWNHTFPEILAAIPRLPGQLSHMLLLFFHYVFIMFGIVGYALNGTVESLGEAAKATGHGIVIAAIYSKNGIVWALGKAVWFFTNSRIWTKVGLFSLYAAGILITCLFAGYTYYEINSSKWMIARKATLLANAAKRKAQREARLAAYLASDEYLALAKQRKLRAREMEKLEEERERLAQEKKNKPKTQSAFFIWVNDVFTNFFGKTEQIGAVTYKALGIFPLIKTMTVATFKGTCPNLVFITPEEIERQKKEELERVAAEKKALAEAMADLNRRIELARNNLGPNRSVMEYAAYANSLKDPEKMKEAVKFKGSLAPRDQPEGGKNISPIKLVSNQINNRISPRTNSDNGFVPLALIARNANMTIENLADFLTKCDLMQPNSAGRPTAYSYYHKYVFNPTSGAIGILWDQKRIMALIDWSYKRTQPAEVAVGNVAPGANQTHFEIEEIAKKRGVPTVDVVQVLVSVGLMCSANLKTPTNIAIGQCYAISNREATGSIQRYLWDYEKISTVLDKGHLRNSISDDIPNGFFTLPWTAQHLGMDEAFLAGLLVSLELAHANGIPTEHATTKGYAKIVGTSDGKSEHLWCPAKLIYLQKSKQADAKKGDNLDESYSCSLTEVSQNTGIDQKEIQQALISHGHLIIDPNLRDKNGFCVPSSYAIEAGYAIDMAKAYGPKFNGTFEWNKQKVLAILMNGTIYLDFITIANGLNHMPWQELANLLIRTNVMTRSFEATQNALEKGWAKRTQNKDLPDIPYRFVNFSWNAAKITQLVKEHTLNGPLNSQQPEVAKRRYQGSSQVQSPEDILASLEKMRVASVPPLWKNQGELAAEYDITSLQLSQMLIYYGLREAGHIHFHDATAMALKEKYAIIFHEGKDRFKSSYAKWDAHLLRPLIATAIKANWFFPYSETV